MPTVKARDYATLAQECVMRSRYIFRDGGLKDVIEMKQPLRAEQHPAGTMAFRMTSTDVFRDPWQGLRPLRVTISAEAYESDPESCNAVLNLVKSDWLDVDLGGSHDVEDLRRFGFEFVRGQGPNWTIRRRSQPTRSFFRWIDDGLLSFLTSSISETGDVPVNAARQLAFDLLAHDSFQNDLFLTSSEYALCRRTDSRVGLLSPKGIVSPSEGRRLVHAFLRTRGDFRLDAHHSVDSTLFYTSLARGLLPQTVRALRHCLAPAHRDALEEAAYHLEGIVTRTDQLLRAADDLTVLSQREARYSAGNALAEEQLFLVQTSSVLVTGALDMLCWFVCGLEGVNPHRKDVSWIGLFEAGRRGPKWIRDLDDPTALALRDAARSAIPLPATVTIAAEFRDCFQHRRPIQGGVADFRNDLGQPAVVASVIDVGASLRGARVDSSTPGLVEREEIQLLLPQVFQRALVADFVDVVEAVLDAVAWDDAAWCTTAPAPGPTMTPIDEFAVLLFGLRGT